MQTFTGEEYLKIDIAGAYGLDKRSWQDRIDWFDNHQGQLAQMMQTAEDPARLFAGAKAMQDVQNGKPIGFMISLDATASGLQILSALIGDSRAASHCNVVSTGNREDAYTNIYRAMLAKTGGAAKIQQADVKQAVMTALYGSRKEPRAVFGKGALLKTFYETMQEELPGAWHVNEQLLNLWDPTALSYDWVLPDNFHSHNKVEDTVTETVMVEGEPFDVTFKVNQPMESGRAIGANVVHSIDGMIVRELTRRCDHNPAQIQALQKLVEMAQSGLGNKETSSYDDQMVVRLWDLYNHSGYLSARILDHLTGDNIGHVDATIVGELLNSLPNKPFKVISNHDCFRVLPHYGNQLREQYNLQLALIANSNLLASIVSQIQGAPAPCEKIDPAMPWAIMQADYALS